jgi:hypothetical protein
VGAEHEARPFADELLMLETLYPLEFPPGLRNNGTVYQSKGRWFIGNLIRFLGGRIMPVGGWSARTLTGATIDGVPTAMLSWTPSKGTTLGGLRPFTAVGTSTGYLYIIRNDVVYDITPTAGSGGQGVTGYWSLSTFGSYLIAVHAISVHQVFPSGNVFVWMGDVNTVAEPTHDDELGPIEVFGAVVTPERFLFLLRGAPNDNAPDVGEEIPYDPEGIIE